MKASYVPLLLAALLAAAMVVAAQANFPRMTTVDPTTAKVGEVVSVAGENLDKANVAVVLLTDGKNDVRVQVTDQTATALKFKVPDSAKPGRFKLVIRTTTTPPKEYVQPVIVTVQ